MPKKSLEQVLCDFEDYLREHTYAPKPLKLPEELEQFPEFAPLLEIRELCFQKAECYRKMAIALARKRRESQNVK